MNDNIENKVNMYGKVRLFLTHHAASFTQPIFTTLQTEHENRYMAILDEIGDSGVDITGYSAEKGMVRKGLEQSMFKIGNAVALHFTITTPSTSRKEKFDFKRGELQKMRDNDLYTSAKKLLDAALPITASMAPFGIATADVTLLQTRMADYLAILDEPQVQRDERTGSLAALDTKIRDMDEFLQTRLDVFMNTIAYDNPELFTVYENVRTIDGSGGGAQPDEDTSITVASGSYWATDDTASISANARIVIDNPAGGPVVIATFSLGQYSNGPVVVNINPGSSFDGRASDLGYDPSRPWLNIFNTANPVAASVTLRIRVYYA